MIVEAGANRYEWIENWAGVVENDTSRANGRTHGVQETSNGEIVVFCQADPSVLFFDRDGKLVRSWGTYLGAHGMTLTVEDGTDYLWLTDEKSGQVVKTTIDGQIVLEISKPQHSIYVSGGAYVPTWVAVNERRWGGNGDVWVADGYGSSLVHRFTETGVYVGYIDGSEGAGTFACPHGIAFDCRSGSRQLLVADRSNRRVQVYDDNGKYLCSFGTDFLVHPDCFSTLGSYLLIPELYGRVALVDGSNHLIGYLGENDSAPAVPGWPNLTSAQIEPGKFSSPHGGTFDRHGNIYIVEWIVGGRIIKLAKLGE